ncbi:MAG: FG-GAP repeat protein [Nannocystaceae bacterium]
MLRRSLPAGSLACAFALGIAPAHAGPPLRDAASVDATIVQTEIAGVDLEQDDRFGWSAEVTGDTVIVGAPGQNAVYVFERDGVGGWIAGPALTGSGALGNAEFGRALAASADTLAIAAPYDVGFAGPGFVYVFERAGGDFVEQAQLTATDGASTEHFGRAIAIDGTTLAATFDGGVQIFVGGGGTWTNQATIAIPGQQPDALAIAGDILLAGVPGETVRGLAGAGAVHVYERSGDIWSQQAVLVAPEAHANAFFGESLDLEANRAVTVGGAYVDQPRLFEFERAGDGSWQLVAQSAPPTATKFFGTAVVRHGDLALVGDQGSLGGSGATQLFARVPGPARLDADWVVTLQTTGGYALGWQGSVFVVGIPNVDNDRGSALIVEFAGAIAGEPCAADEDCISGHCIASVCCGQACDGCNVCTAAEGASRDGVCTTLPPTQCCPSDDFCDDQDPCTQDLCDAGTCRHELVCCASDAECDDGDECTADACSAGSCAATPIPGCTAATTTADGGSATASATGDDATAGTDSTAGASSPGEGCSCALPAWPRATGAWWLVIAFARRRRQRGPTR